MKTSLFIATVLGLVFGITAFAQTQSSVSDFNINSPKPEISINKDGKISIIGAKIIQFAGSTIYTRVTWENSFIRLIIKTGQSTTNMTRRFGESINISNISVGDYLSIDGMLESGADTLSIIASSLKNLSDQTQQNNFSGTITAIDPSYTSFTLNSKTLGSINVISSSATLALGSRTVDAYHLKVGGKITSATGVYDFATKTLQAQKITIYIDMSQFKARNHKGVLKTMSGTELPATMVISVGSKDYTVKLSADTQLINNKRRAIVLSRFVEGDDIVFYGAIQENDNPIIDNVEIMRNASL